MRSHCEGQAGAGVRVTHLNSGGQGQVRVAYMSSSFFWCENIPKATESCMNFLACQEETRMGTLSWTIGPDEQGLGALHTQLR